MAKITLDLNTFKASGVYTIEFDASERIVVTTQTVRLVVGFSRLGPINAPVFLRDVNTCRRIFGEIDYFLEKRGSFFHRAMETCLTTGPIFALNLMPLRSVPVNEGGDATNYRSFALAANETNGPVSRALVTSFYNKERFWFPDREYVIATADALPINRDYLLTVVNLSQAPLSVIVRKSVNAGQYNVSAQDYYGMGNVPDYMNPNDFLSDFFLDLVIVEGDWTDLGLLRQDPFYSKFFDSRGLKVNMLESFLSLDNVTMVGSFTGTIIPDFIDNQGSNQFIENIVNAAVGLTGIFIGVNVAKIDDYMNSTRKIDTIGNSLIAGTDDVIDFLSYNTPIKNILEFTGERDLGVTSTDVTTYDGAGAGLNTSTSQIYVKSYPFGGRSGKWNNVLVIPKPQPADTVFLPSQYQYIVDNLSTNSLIKSYGLQTFEYEQPNDWVKVEKITDTGNDLQIQISSPLNSDSSYFEGIIFTGEATTIPSVANDIDVTALVDSKGVPYTPVAGDFILVEAPGFAKYYQVDAFTTGTAYDAIDTTGAVTYTGTIPSNVFTDIPATGGTGTGATFDIYIDDTGPSATVSVNKRGSGYTATDLLTIDGGTLGGVSGLDDVTVVVSTVIGDGGTITVEAVSANISTDAPYYFNQYASVGLDIADYASYLQPSDIKITLLVPDPATSTATVNSLVPYLGVSLPSTDFGISLEIAFNPTVTVASYEGIGTHLTGASGAATALTAPLSTRCSVYNLTTDTPYLNPSSVPYFEQFAFIHDIVESGASVAGARELTVTLKYTTGTYPFGSGNISNVALTPGEEYRITLADSGVTFTGIAASTTTIDTTDLLALKYVESYPGSKLTTAAQSNLVVNGDSIKYDAGASAFNYLGVIPAWSRSSQTGSVDPYSQVAYGLRGSKISQYTATDLVTRASATFASVDQTFENATIYSPGIQNDLAIYSSLAKSLSSNIPILGTLFGGGKKFELSNANSVNLNVGDLLVDNSLNPRLTRVVQKTKKVNPSTAVVTYEYTVLDVPAVNTMTNTVTKFTPIQNFCDRLQFTLLQGYEITEYHLPNNTDAQIEKIYSVIENTNIGKTLASRDIIQFRYVIDTFNGGIAPQMGPKAILARLARNRQKCMALLNAPSIKQFIASTDPRFSELPDPAAGNPKPLLNTRYIAEGGNLSLGPSFTFSLPDEENGAKFIGVFSPNVLIRENNKNWSVPPAADVSNNFVRKFINGQPYAIVAGPRRGVISNPKFAGLEFEYLLQDREYLEPFGINPIVTVKGIGPMIYANQSGYQRTLSAFNNLHVRDLLITIEEAIEDVLTQYLFEFNDASTRLEIRTIVENYLDTVRNAGGVYDYAVIMDDTNNTPAVIDQNFGIIDVGIEPTRGLQKFINRVTILKTGTISSGGFAAA